MQRRKNRIQEKKERKTDHKVERSDLNLKKKDCVQKVNEKQQNHHWMEERMNVNEQRNVEVRKMEELNERDF